MFNFNKNNTLYFIFLKILNIMNIEYDRPKVWKIWLIKELNPFFTVLLNQEAQKATTRTAAKSVE